MAEGEADIDIEMGEMDGDLDPTIMSFQASAIIAVCAAVIIGNGFVCALNCLKIAFRRLYMTFVLISAVVNTAAALVTMPLMAASLIQGEWKFGFLLCKMTGSICFGSMVFTMTFIIVAAISKLSLFVYLNFTTLYIRTFLQKDFVIIVIVCVFVFISQLVLFSLIDRPSLNKDPYKVLCHYANSPNITGYRMFYISYSTLLTLAALVLVMPIYKKES